jgi:diaminopimelate decarboxylase
MHHFAYRDGVLHAEGIDLAGLAAEIGTPFYCYSTATLERHYRVFAEPFAGTDALVCYSVKANSNLGVLATLGRLGAGMDVVSGGELRRARAAGIGASRIVFSGVGKTKEEMRLALEQQIFAFNVESEAEIRALSEEARQMGKSARIALRINPDIDAKTHHKIATGKAENKFGIPYDDALDLYKLAEGLESVDPRGVHMHIGSQITDLEPFHNAFSLLDELVRRLREEGIAIDFVNLGGGLGIPYRSGEPDPPHPRDYAELVRKTVGALGCRLLFEPGRMIAGNAGILVARVLYTKRGESKHFTIVDAGMNDLMRPTLYEAHHEILPVAEPDPGTKQIVTDLVGPVCETGDYFALSRSLPELRAGDLVALMTAGAYGAVLASTYNSRLLVPEVMVSGDDYAVVRPRPGYEAMLEADRIPAWIGGNHE